MTDNQSIIFPAPLRQGDKIVFCSPASVVKEELVTQAAEVLTAQGWRVEIMPHALGKYGSYSATDAERLSDLRRALLDPEVKAIICSRGGYGVVHIMEDLAKIDLRGNAKWIVGFSDISALHALMASAGVASVHASMAAHISLGADDEDNAALFDILRGGRPAHIFDGHAYDRAGIATGKLLGGNLAVLAELISTPYDILRPDTILFIEDIAEPIYKVERILYQLQMSGVLAGLKGLIVGQFTDYKPDDNYTDIYDMIRDMVARYDYPVAFNAPIGHVDHNVPLIESAQITLKVNPEARNSIIFHRD